MKLYKLILIIYIGLHCSLTFGQKDLSNYKDISSVKVTGYWGDINISGTQSKYRSNHYQ